MRQRRAGKSRRKSERRKRSVARGLIFPLSLSVFTIAYVSAGADRFDFASSLNTLRQLVQRDQTIQPTSDKKSDRSVQIQTTTVAESPAPLTASENMKDDLALTRVQESSSPGFPKPIETPDSRLAFDSQPSTQGTPDGFNPAASAEHVAETDGTRVLPTLRRDATSGQLLIGNFRVLTVPGPQSSCVRFAQMMLKDVGAPADKMRAELTNPQISIYKICASNGAVVITCRGGNIVVSPRQPRPDDQCARTK